MINKTLDLLDEHIDLIKSTIKSFDYIQKKDFDFFKDEIERVKSLLIIIENVRSETEKLKGKK